MKRNTYWNKNSPTTLGAPDGKNCELVVKKCYIKLTNLTRMKINFTKNVKFI